MPTNRSGNNSSRGTRFREAPTHRKAPSTYRGASARPGASVRPGAHARRSPNRRGPRPAVVVLALLLVIGVGFAAFQLLAPLSGRFLGMGEVVEAGQDVEVKIPEGASGDVIARVLAEAHVIENPKDYYAEVDRQHASMSIKPGHYLLKTGEEPEDVVAQLVDGPNIEEKKLVIQEGLTVEQTAKNVEAAYGIPASEFMEAAKASRFEKDYPFLKGVYNDSLEGYLYPKTYSFEDEPTSDDIIRALLDQFRAETKDLGLSKGSHGLTSQQIVSMASLIERETAVDSERPLVASVIYNRLKAEMPLQIDAAIVYARGGGSQAVSYKDLEIDSPYNVYKNRGLTPGPICSPSISAIKAVVDPADTDYLYYVASSKGDGSHKFSRDYDDFLKNSDEYNRKGVE